MVSHLKKLAIAVESDPTQNFIISNVSEGVSESTSFMYEAEYEQITIEDEQPLTFAKVHTISAVGLIDGSIDESIISTLNDPDEKAHVAAVGIDGALISLNSVRVEVLDHPDSGHFWKFRITKKTVPWADPDTGIKSSGFFVGENLLAVAEYGDFSGDEILNGWRISDSNNLLISSDFDEATGVQSLSVSAASGTFEYEFAEPIFYPFKDILTFSVEFTNVPSLANWDASLTGNYVDEDGTEGTGGSVQIQETAERQQLFMRAFEEPVGGAVGLFVRPIIKFFGGEDASDIVDLQFRDPDLRVGQLQDSELKYTRY